MIISVMSEITVRYHSTTIYTFSNIFLLVDGLSSTTLAVISGYYVNSTRHLDIV